MFMKFPTRVTARLLIGSDTQTIRTAHAESTHNVCCKIVEIRFSFAGAR